MSAPFGPRMFVHSCHVRTKNPDGDAVVVKEYVWHPDGRVTPELRWIENPQRRFFVTKKMYRTHSEKKEAELLDRVESYSVPNHMLEVELFRQLEGYYPRRRPKLRELCDSPYVYGADIDIQTLIKAKYKEDFAKSGAAPVQVTTGFFDTETSMHPGTLNQLTIASITHENKVYTAVLRRVFYKMLPNGTRVDGTVEDLAEFSRTILQPEIDRTFQLKGLREQKHKNNFEFHYHIAESSAELLQWIFSRQHENRTDFVGVWNIDFDVGKVVLPTLKEAGIPAEDVLCPPELPPRFRSVKYARDEKQVDHFTKKWHWLHTTSYSQWYDAQCLYSNLRTVIGKEVSYALDYILKRNGVGGKLYFKDLPDLDHLSGAEWHRKMQTDYPYHYIVYNQWDVVSLQLMEWKNQDVASMYLLSEMSSIAKYTRQTRKAADQLYFAWLKRGRVLASAGTSMVGPYDHLIPKVGGAVLRPERVDYSGMNALREAPHIRTMIHIMVNDVDFTGMYPNTAMGCNVSKETKLSTVLGVNLPSANDNQKQRAVEEVFSCMVSPHENAVYIGRTFFGLPGYQQMGDLFEEELKKEMAA